MMFQIVSTVVIIGFIIVFGLILFSIIKGISEWSRNNQQPLLTVPAKVVTKRTGTRGGGETRVITTYFVTFETGGSERKEFQIKGEEFGLLTDGDSGELSYQGTRFKAFTRSVQ
ncbi:DUF2500 domain-containing protein [Bacillus sp. FJAT-42376]|nr:DUF2500 domain-containing protein [Bacillus sp. FJAT-42376]